MYKVDSSSTVFIFSSEPCKRDFITDIHTIAFEISIVIIVWLINVD